MSQFPTIIPTFTDFDGNQTLAQNNHASRHNKVHEEVAAIAAKVGIDSSTDPDSLDKKTADLRSEVNALTPAYEGYVDQSIEDNVTIGVNSTTGFTDFNASQFYSSGGMFTITSSAVANAAANKPATTTDAGWLETKMLSGSVPGVSAWAYVTQTYTTISGKVYTRMVNSSATPTPVNFSSWKSTVDMDSVYPIGSIYTNATTATNPAILLGFGTWTAFGAGRVPVGYSSGETEFNAVEKTGGAKTHTLTVGEMPSHGHILRRDTSGPETGIAGGGTAGANSISGTFNNATNIWPNSIYASATGGGGAHNNLQPYITVYMWKRTA